MSIVADRFDLVIGVDAHTDSHTAVVVNPIGAVTGRVRVNTDADGLAQLLAWGGRHAGTSRLLWAVDGTRSHGLGLTQVLVAAGQQVVEAPRPAKSGKRRGGKSDAGDAAAIAREVLATPVAKLAQPRTDGLREALRIALVCRRHDTDIRTATINLFKSLVLTADSDIRELLLGKSIGKQARIAAAWTPSTPDADTPTALRRTQLAALATDILTATSRINANLRRLQQLVTQWCPILLDQPGVGPVTAATLLVTWSHPGRFRHEAAFANLAGVSPIPASSGRITRHRLNRGGDRTLNAALHTIAITRRRYDQATRDYVENAPRKAKPAGKSVDA